MLSLGMVENKVFDRIAEHASYPLPVLRLARLGVDTIASAIEG